MPIIRTFIIDASKGHPLPGLRLTVLRATVGTVSEADPKTIEQVLQPDPQIIEQSWNHILRL